MATIALRGGALDRTELPLLWLSVTSASKQHAVAGTSQLNVQVGIDSPRKAGKSRVSSFADWRRGTQERNCVSNGFIGFIRFSFQACFHFLQTVTVATGGSVR